MLRAEMQIPVLPVSPAWPSSDTAGGTEAPRVTRSDSQKMQAHTINLKLEFCTDFTGWREAALEYQNNLGECVCSL